MKIACFLCLAVVLTGCREKPTPPPPPVGKAGADSPIYISDGTYVRHKNGSGGVSDFQINAAGQIQVNDNNYVAMTIECVNATATNATSGASVACTKVSPITLTPAWNLDMFTQNNGTKIVTLSSSGNAVLVNPDGNPVGFERDMNDTSGTEIGNQSQNPLTFQYAVLTSGGTTYDISCVSNTPNTCKLRIHYCPSGTTTTDCHQ